MWYPYQCDTHGRFETKRSIREDIPAVEPCPECGEMSPRVYEAPEAVIYYGSGFHSTDYFKQSKGRGQPMDRKEWLNSNWSKATGEKPPPPSGGKE